MKIETYRISMVYKLREIKKILKSHDMRTANSEVMEHTYSSYILDWKS